MVPKYHTKQLQNRCTAVPVFKPATHSVCCSNPAGSREEPWGWCGSAGGGGAAGRWEGGAGSRGCSGGNAAAAPELEKFPPREPTGGKSVTWRRRTVKQGRRGKSLPLSAFSSARDPPPVFLLTLPA